MTATFEGDLYSRAALRDAYPAYAQLRAMGPAVWMPKRRMWAVARYDGVRACLRAAEALVSGHGVAANDTVNRLTAPVTLTSDGETHDRRRLALIQPLTPAPLKDLRPRLEAEAAGLVNTLADGRTFEAMSTFATYLPVTIVAELVGLDAWARRRMLRWAAAAFNSLGVMNLRGLAAVPVMQGLGRYVRDLDRKGVTPGGWADWLFDAADRGDISHAEARAMIIDYVAPALDTTILATGQMLWRLATTPGAYDAVRADPSLIPGAVNEAVRMGSPIRGFTRYAAEAFELDGVTIPAGDRALILFASANRDPDKYPDPDRFDVTRNPRDHVGWGHGQHTCVGMHLARLEMEVLLAALVQRVARIETDRPTPAWNNVLQGFARLPARLTPVSAPRGHAA
jgi:cytochrome P450